METIAPHIGPRGSSRAVVFFVSAALIATVGAVPPNGRAGGSGLRAAASPRIYTITYTAHTGDLREATLLLPVPLPGPALTA